MGSSEDEGTLPARAGLDELDRGRLLGDWIIESRGNRGGFATIYRARHAEDGRQAAVKVLHASLVHSAAILSRFRREAATITELRHPGIVETYGVGLIDDGRPFIVMEWLDGRDLARELDARGPLPLDEAVAIMEALGPPLAAAHARGVVHRDIKPQNVMRLPSGGIKLVDFGIAKLTDPALLGEGLTRTGEVVGTPTSMAPEQIRNTLIDARTDIYALGLMLYQLLTGRVAFGGASASEVQDKHLHAPPPRASEHAAVGEAVDGVIARCLEKEREARFPDVEAFLAALRAAVGPAARAEPSGVALYVAAAVDDEASDEQLDALEGVLERVRGAARGERMTLIADTGTSLLAVREPDGPEERRRTVAWARELARGLAAPFDLALVLHAGGMEPLLQAAEWTAGHPRAGLVATAAMVGGTESERFVRLL